MKKQILSILILLLTVSLCACGPKNAAASPEPSDTSSQANGTSAPAAQSDTAAAPADTSAVKPDGGSMTIEITPPDGWEPMTGSVLAVHYMKNTASFMAKEEPFTGTTLDEILGEAQAIYGNAFDNFTVTGGPEPATIDGREAKTLTFTCEISGMTMKYLYAYVIVDGKTFVITFGDLESSFDSLSADFDTILSEIRFVTE